MRAEFIGEIVQLSPGSGQNDPLGFDTEIGHSEWGLLSAPAGPHRFTLTEIAGNGWHYDLAIKPL